MTPSDTTRCHRLVYVSRAVEPMTRPALVELLEQARAHNTENGITGLLVYRDRAFVQLLEGERDDVQSLYARITADPRHQDVVLVASDEEVERHFPDWSMGFHDSTQDLEALDGYSDVLDGDRREREETDLVRDLLNLFDPVPGPGRSARSDPPTGVASTSP